MRKYIFILYFMVRCAHRWLSRGLMEQEDLRQLGMREYSDIKIARRSREKEERGFVAGVSRAEAAMETRKK